MKLKIYLALFIRFPDVTQNRESHLFCFYIAHKLHTIYTYMEYKSDEKRAKLYINCAHYLLNSIANVLNSMYNLTKKGKIY
ncbi:hypothetical protein SAMN02799633_04245 [Bacillus sp. UNCCL81]|nr:hypothetical protein SAMN02799633_04245 [Bacillus sp. UNCCL81]